MMERQEQQSDLESRAEHLQDVSDELRSLDMRLESCHHRSQAVSTKRELEMVWQDLDRLREEAQNMASCDPRHSTEYLPRADRAIDEQQEVTNRIDHLRP